MRRVFLHLTISLAAVVCCLPGMASTISAGTPVAVADGGTAPGSPFDYDFFGGGTVPGPVLNNFTVNVQADDHFAGNAFYTTLVAPGGSVPFTTGVAYDNSNSLTPPVLLATFSPTSDGGFTVWVLDGNTDGNQVGNTTIGLGVNGGTPVEVATVTSGVNEFTEYLVSGALTSDVFDVYATPASNNHASIGGLTFTAPGSAVPEPSTFVLGLFVLSLGALGLLVVRRKTALRS